ncbi:MAG: sugar transferase, partial [Coleofasciculus sp. C2-GNP5-27]
MTFRDYSDTSIKVDTTKPHSGRRRAIYRIGAKRCLDVVLVLMTLPISLPLILGMMCLVAIDGGSPIYRQKRLGRGGRVFHM